MQMERLNQAGSHSVDCCSKKDEISKPKSAQWNGRQIAAALLLGSSGVAVLAWYALSRSHLSQPDLQAIKQGQGAVNSSFPDKALGTESVLSDSASVIGSVKDQHNQNVQKAMDGLDYFPIQSLTPNVSWATFGLTPERIDFFSQLWSQRPDVFKL